MYLCPFCQSQVEAKPVEFTLTSKQKQVYEAIISAGPDGITVSDLMEKIYPGRSYVTLRTALYYIRRAVAPIQIVSKGKRYSVQLLEKKE